MNSNKLKRNSASSCNCETTLDRIIKYNRQLLRCPLYSLDFAKTSFCPFRRLQNTTKKFIRQKNILRQNVNDYSGEKFKNDQKGRT